MAKASTKRRKRGTSAKGSRSGMTHWYLAAAVIVGGIVAYDHREKLGALPAASELTALFSSSENKRPLAAEKRAKVASAPARPKEHTGSIEQKPALTPPMPVARAVERPLDQTAPRLADSATFYFCGIRHDNCVIDGDTFLFNGERILIADIDAPETKLAKCDGERSRGSHAKARLRELLNAGEFTLVASPRGFSDGEAGKPRVLMRNGKSLGDVLISEGLVRKRGSRPASWCGPTAVRASG